MKGHKFFGRCYNKSLHSLPFFLLFLSLLLLLRQMGWGWEGRERKEVLPSACGLGQGQPRNPQVSRCVQLMLQGLQELWEKRRWMCAPRKKKDTEFMEVAQEGKWFQTREKQTKQQAVCVAGVRRVGERAGSCSLVPAVREWVLSKYLLF